MKNHFLSLFDPAHRMRTIIYFLASVLLITGSQIVGTTDNLPGISMLLLGMIGLFLTFLHTWRKRKNYMALAGICAGLTLLTFLTIYILMLLHKTQYISEGFVMMTVFLLYLPGFLVGITGAIVYRNK